MCRDIEKIFNFQTPITYFNNPSPHFRRNMDLFNIDTFTSNGEAT